MIAKDRLRSFYWWLYGVVIGAGGYALIYWAGNQTPPPAWYAWVLLVLGIGGLTFTWHHFVESCAELEPKAGWVGLGFFGVPSCIVSALAVWSFV